LRKAGVYIFVFSILLIYGCQRSEKMDYDSMHKLLEDLGKHKNVEFNKYPPRLVKAFLKMDKSNNEGLQELLGMSRYFDVAHIPKKIKESGYKDARMNIAHNLERLNYELMLEIEIENIVFKEHYLFDHTKKQSIVLEIDESELYTIYYLDGDFTREDVIRVSKEVSPIEFLKLNRKIRNK